MEARAVCDELLAQLRQMVHDDPESREALGLEVASRVVAIKLVELVRLQEPSDAGDR